MRMDRSEDLAGGGRVGTNVYPAGQTAARGNQPEASCRCEKNGMSASVTRASGKPGGSTPGRGDKRVCHLMK